MSKINNCFLEIEPTSQLLLAAGPLTMDRLADTDSVVVSQTTSQFCRCCCWQPSINFSVTAGTNTETAAASHEETLDAGVGWVHEESGFWGRCLSHCFPGGRSTKYVFHSGPIPEALKNDERTCLDCIVQSGDVSEEFGGLDPSALGAVQHTHEKQCTNGITMGVGDKRCPCCVNLPYLESKNARGEVIGRTEYVCDACLFVPKLALKDKSGEERYRIRPDTCVGGACVRCRCGGEKGRCCRLPWVIRDPHTHEAVAGSTLKRFGPQVDNKAQITKLWTGIRRECSKKSA